AEGWSGSDDPGTHATRVTEDFELLTFEEVWEASAELEACTSSPETLVCFLSDPADQQAVAQVVEELSAQTKVIFVVRDRAADANSADGYVVRSGDRDSCRQVLGDICATYGNVSGLLYMWPLEDAACLQDPAIIVDILQSLASTQLSCKRLLLVGEFASGLERCHLESWIGFERALRLAWPQTEVVVIGQEKEPGAARIRTLMLRLWNELGPEKAESAFYIEGKRQVCRIHPRAPQAAGDMLRDGGTYLITGGCGGLGFLFADYLARTRAANLVLNGRSALDDKKREKIRALEALGSQVLYVQADVCDHTRLSEGLAAAEARFGAVHGVIHAAGLSGGGSVFEKDRERFRQVLAPKIDGTLVLDEVLRGKALDFVCYFSSSAAILGDFGSCDYAVGNRFLMAHAQYGGGQRHSKRIVINWGLWADGGMGFGSAERTRMYLKSSGQRALEAGEGAAVFERLLGEVATQHLVLAGQPSRVHQFLGIGHGTTARQPARFHSAAADPGRRAELKGLSVSQCVAWDLKEHASRLLKVPRDRLDVDENLAEFGFDSISLAKFAGALSGHYGIPISPALFFSHPTLAQLTDYFVEAQAAAMEAFYRQPAAEPAGFSGQARITAPLLKRLQYRRSKP
ncbi:beta-ketoacyl reductase, partial [Bradyrhizobium sp. SZCCHNRI2049]|uniref:beta-ketoacyl reductase n=1 Tax=Bradyrhizobium sp. SZCCHNRI2049 TaxID=3057287 RepID=UPI00291611D5